MPLIGRKETAEVISLMVKCQCGHENKLTKDDLMISYNVSPCDLCGDHGEVWLEPIKNCEKCEGKLKIQLVDW